MTGDLSVIIGIIKNTFASVSPVVFLIFGVFLALWLFGILGNAFMDFAETKASFRLKKPEEREIRILAGLAKRRGLPFDRKKVMREVEKEKENVLFKKLGKKYGVLKE